MSNAQWLLEIVLVALLGATMFHAIRLERALGVLRRDRAALEGLIAGFNESTRQAETGSAKLLEAAEGAGLQITRQVDRAGVARDDLRLLIDRGERLADGLERLVRKGGELAAPQDRRTEPPVAAAVPVPAVSTTTNTRERTMNAAPHGDVRPRLAAASKVEMDLIRALRLGGLVS